MLKEAIYHRPEGSYASVTGPNTLRVRLRIKRGDPISPSVVWGDRYDWVTPNLSTPMTVATSDELFDYYEAELHHDSRRFRYLFKLEEGDQVSWFGEDGFSKELSDPIWTAGHFHFPYIRPENVFRPPSWVEGAVFYSIVLDRFCNGDPNLNPPNVQPWGASPTLASFSGGDLPGLISRLPYLEDLGITAVWLTPIFLASTNHKYNCADYYTIDPHLGTLETFKQVLEKAHQHGIRIVLDAVFNHCGLEFFAFQDVLKHGQDSRYAGWFEIYGFPVDLRRRNYETFAMESHMPKLITTVPAVRDYLLEVASYWTKLGVDGWRLDVADEVDHEFWRHFRRTVKTINPEVYIVGEIGHDASPWLQGDQFDGVMNYPFLYACDSFFAQQTSSAAVFMNRLNWVRVSYPDYIQPLLMNLIDSHDTPRLLTRCKGNEQRWRLAVLQLFCYRGAPMVYYGDEIGMEGGGDPDCRRTMIWDTSPHQQRIFAYFRCLIALRRSHPALTAGTVVPLSTSEHSKGGIVAYARVHARESLAIIMNNTPDSHTLVLNVPSGLFPGEIRLLDLLSGQEVGWDGKQLQLHVGIYEGMVVGIAE